MPENSSVTAGTSLYLPHPEDEGFVPIMRVGADDAWRWVAKAAPDALVFQDIPVKDEVDKPERCWDANRAIILSIDPALGILALVKTGIVINLMHQAPRQEREHAIPEGAAPTTSDT